MKELHDIFIDENEKESLVLGDWYLRKFLKGEAMRGGFCVLTDKRLYLNGRYFHKAGRGYRAEKGEYAIDIESVTASGFSTARFGIVLVLEILFVIALSLLTALFLVVVDAVEHYGFSYESIAWSCLVLLALGLVAAPVFFYLKPFRIFVIEYAGSEIAVLAFDYLEEDVRLLRKMLYQTRETLIPALCPQRAAEGAPECEGKDSQERI